METTYKTLAQFLASINLTEKELKRLIGLSIPRLRAIFKHGDVTKQEFMLLLKAMTAHQAADLVFASQAGSFNQNGIGNEQHVNVTNNYVLIIMRRLGLIPGPDQPSALPVAPKPVIAVQQRVVGQFPASQVAPIKGVVSIGCVC
jgi:hypothetical protein